MSASTNGRRRGWPPWHWWRTVFYLIPAISLYTILLGVVSLASQLLERRGRLAHRCARLWSACILKTTGVTVRTSGQRPTETTSCVFVANHQSIYDIPVVFATLPVQLRIMAKASLGWIPFLGWHLRRTGHVLVDRDQPGASVVKKMRRLISERASLMVFPEGTRSLDGTVGRFKAGVFLIAIERGLDVVPISLGGTRHIMRKGQLMTCPGIVQVTVHPAISTRGLERRDARALASRVQAIVAGGAS